MTDDEKFFERLRDDARQLRYDADDVMMTRIAARVRARIAEQPTVAGLLSAWFRPLAASLMALATAAVLSVTLIGDADVTSDEPETLEAMATTSMQVEVDGVSYRVSD